MCIVRKSKGAHVLEKVRAGLGKYQKEFAKALGCSESAIQQIELGKLALSRRMAMRISERTGVSVEWLLTNDPEREIVNVFGRKWSPDTKRIELFRERWAKLQPMVRACQVLICQRLLEDYLCLRSLIESLPNPGKAMREWESYHREAFLKFLETYKPISERFGFNPKELTANDYLRLTVGASSENLGSIQGDIDAVMDALHAGAKPRNYKEILAHLFVLGGNHPYQTFERVFNGLAGLSDEDLKKKTLGEIKWLINSGNVKQSPKKQQRSRALRAA